MKYFNTQQETADEAHLLVNNADIQEIDDLQQDDFPETPREHLQEGSNELDTDESSVSQFDLIVYLLLELREKYNVSASTTCVTSDILGHVVEKDRHTFANKLTGQKSLPTYVKAKKCLVEPKELQVGFDPKTGKADFVQYIPRFGTLKILISTEDIFLYHIEQQNSVTSNFNLSSDKTLRSFHNGNAFYQNRRLDSRKKNSGAHPIS